VSRSSVVPPTTARAASTAPRGEGDAARLLPPPRTRHAMAGLVGALAAGVGVVAAVGVLGRGDGSTRTFESVRGAPWEVVTDGVYAFSPERMVAEGVGWDVVTLLVAVPCLLVLTWGLARGSLRARLLTLGLLAYLTYQYLMYAVTWAMGPLFLPFVAIYATSLVLLLWVASTVPLAVLPAQVTARFPRRATIAVCLGFPLLLLGMWVPLVADVLGDDLDVLYGQTTLPVQALDLGLLVPLGIATAVLLWRRSPLGLLLATTVIVKGVAMGGAIVAMLLSAWYVEGSVAVAELAIFGTVTLVCAGLLVAALRAVTEPSD
jgi:hypothetical protein